MVQGALSGIRERTRRAQGDGRRYGAVLLSVFAIVFLVVVLPWFLNLSAEIAMRTAAEPTKATPYDQGSTYSLENAGITWAGWTDAPVHAAWAGIIHECVPYDNVYAAPVDAFPGFEIAYPYRFVEDQNGSNKTYLNVGSYFRDPTVPVTDPMAAFNFCSTINDEIEWRFNNTHGPFSTDEGLAATRFNMTTHARNCTSSCFDTNSSLLIGNNYTWRVEVNGEVMFGKTIVWGDPESYSRTSCYVNCTQAGHAAGLARYYPTISFEHELSIEESYRLRNALQAQDAATLDARLIWSCTTDPALPYGHNPGDVNCVGVEQATGDIIPFTDAEDHFIYAEVEYVQADDWTASIKASMAISGVAMIWLALASTPFYNPVLKALRRFNR